MNFKTWMKGLGVAVAGAAIPAVAQATVNRMQSGKDAPPVTSGNIGVAAGASALIAVLTYMLQSPIQPTEKPQ